MKGAIIIAASVKADINKVWNYYTAAEHITKWNFATEDWQCPKVSVDLRVGGKHFARMEAKDGSFGFDFEAVYDEIVPNQILGYTMADGRRAEILFKQTNDRTEVSITFDADNNPIELQRNGWQAILNNFKSYTENN